MLLKQRRSGRWWCQDSRTIRTSIGHQFIIDSEPGRIPTGGSLVCGKARKGEQRGIAEENNQKARPCGQNLGRLRRLLKEHHDRGQLNEGQEVAAGLLIPSRHPAILLDSIDEPFHQVSHLYRYLSKSRGCFRFTLGGMTASAPLVSIDLTSGSLSYALSAITAAGE